MNRRIDSLLVNDLVKKFPRKRTGVTKGRPLLAADGMVDIIFCGFCNFG
jgi:hypothetical protein